MKKLMMIGLAALGFSLGATAEDGRVDDARYSIEEESMPASVTAHPDAVRQAAPSVDRSSEALAALRAEHARAYEELEAACLAANNADREALERQAMTLKAEQQREELELLLDEAEARGDAAYAEDLRAALNADLAPRPEPKRVHVVRDPATGDVISGNSEEAVR